MALISCPECKHRVSEQAEACPQCGYPLSGDPKRVSTSEDSFLTRNRGLGDILLFGPIVLIILLVVASAARGCGL